MLDIIYSDEYIVLCIKPVGIDSEDLMPQLLSDELGGDFFPVHRLDLNVSGLMVYARTREAAAELSEEIRLGAFIKEYVALVHGTPPKEDTLRDLLWKDSAKNKVYVVNRRRSGVKLALLEYTRRSEGETSLVEILLHTGRSHQIRVQFSSRGYPIVGDHKYGSRDERTAPCLFAHRLTFHFNGVCRTFEAPLPDWASERMPKKD